MPTHKEEAGAAEEAKASSSSSSSLAPSLGRMAHTLHHGREEFAHRVAVVASTHAQALDGLRVAADEASEAAEANALGAARKAPSVMFVFPGQGSQTPRMGEGLYRGEPTYRRHVDRLCTALLEPLLGFDLRRKLYGLDVSLGDPDDKDAAYLAEFNSPMVTQPAIFVTELALGYTLVDYGIVPTGLAGH